MQIGAVSASSAVAPVSLAVSPVSAAAAVAQPSGRDQNRAPASPVRLLNPQPTIDPSLGIVVTERFNRSGELISQYPTRQALANYRIYGLPGNAG